MANLDVRTLQAVYQTSLRNGTFDKDATVKDVNEFKEILEKCTIVPTLNHKHKSVDYGILPLHPSTITTDLAHMAYIYLARNTNSHTNLLTTSEKPRADETILLLHDTNLTMYGWSQSLLTELIKNYNLVLIDYPGLLGYSKFRSKTSEVTLDGMTDALREFLEVVDLLRVRLVGYAFGGMMVQLPGHRGHKT